MELQEIQERLRILRNVQQSFIDVEDWEEVSKVQFDIDELTAAKAKAKKPYIELWFRVAFFENIFIPILKAEVSKLIYALEWEEKLRNKKP